MGEEIFSRIGFGKKVEIDKSKIKKILITGANSYIGTSFENYAKEHYKENFEIDTINMKDASWREHDFSKYDAVFHVAGIAHADIGRVSEETKQMYYEVNTKLAIETAKKSKKAGIKQFIYMSSIIIYGESAPYGKQKKITKDTKPEPTNFYGDSKWQADIGVRKLADNSFNVLVLRPPMIYGKGSKGNYPTLSKISKKLSIFPNVKNERSMLYIENLCEFLCQVMLVGGGGIFFPQNTEYTNTCTMAEYIKDATGKKIKKLKILNIFVKVGTLIPGRIREIINKAFGNLIIDQDISNYEGIDYRHVSLKESIERTEKKTKNIDNICIVNCFDTYEHRIDMLYNYFNRMKYKVKVYTSNYRHIEKCYREDKKENYYFFNTRPYKKNMSISRILSHIRLSKDIFKKINEEDIDLLWVLVPPNSIVKYAAKYKKKNCDTKLIFDIIDMWPETMPIASMKRIPIFTYWKNLRDSNLNLADKIITECNLYHEMLPKSIDNKRIQTIYLARELKEHNNILNLPEEKISLCYLGSINNIIDIDVIKNLITKLIEIKPVELHIIGDGEKKDEFINSCKDAGADVIFYAKIYDINKKQEIFNSCHYGLNIMKESVFVGLTMKSMDYFEAGLPIINNIRGDTWDMIEKNNIGINLCDNIDYKIFKEYNIENRKLVRKFYEENFGIKEFEKKVEDVLNGE